MMKRLMLLVCVGCAALIVAASAFAGARPALTRANAESRSSVDAANIWGGQVYKIAPSCTGPYENVKGRTQWACYGGFETGAHAGEYWQINLDPYGTITFDRTCTSKCPGDPH